MTSLSYWRDALEDSILWHKMNFQPSLIRPKFYTHIWLEQPLSLWCLVCPIIQPFLLFLWKADFLFFSLHHNWPLHMFHFEFKFSEVTWSVCTVPGSDAVMQLLCCGCWYDRCILSITSVSWLDLLNSYFLSLQEGQRQSLKKVCGGGVVSW